MTIDAHGIGLGKDWVLVGRNEIIEIRVGCQQVEITRVVIDFLWW